jgi:hypothetical protein
MNIISIVKIYVYVCMNTKFLINSPIQSKGIVKKKIMNICLVYEHFHTNYKG